MNGTAMSAPVSLGLGNLALGLFVQSWRRAGERARSSTYEATWARRPLAAYVAIEPGEVPELPKCLLFPGGVLVVAVQPGHGRAVRTAWRPLPVLLAAQGGHVQPVVGAHERVEAPPVRGVGVED